MTTRPADDSYVISYMGLRKAIGAVGMALPFVVPIGDRMSGGFNPDHLFGLRTSLSAYYYGATGDLFVGAMCAIGVFLFSYSGPQGEDRVYGRLACAFAVGVALFPTSLKGATGVLQYAGWAHVASAAALFLTLAYFSLKLFTRSDRPRGDRGEQKEKRNRVYVACGWTILASIALIALSALPAFDFLDRYCPKFWLEALAILAFGVSWATKGEAILADRKLGAGTAPGDPALTVGMA